MYCLVLCLHLFFYLRVKGICSSFPDLPKWKKPSISSVWWTLLQGLVARKARWEILHRLSEQFYFHLQAYIILQTVSVCNAYAQINPCKGNTDRKSRTATAQWEFLRSYTAAEINHDLVCTFIEVSAVYRFCYKPNLTVLKSCMMLSIINVFDNRELKQLRRRRRRQLQKTIGLMIKTTALHVHHAF